MGNANQAAHPVEAVRVMKQRGPLATACVADMQGWRDSHEDAHFMDQPDGGTGWASFGVLDGHGGQKAALLASETLPIALKKATKGRKPKDGPGLGKLQAAFEEVDADLRNKMDDGREPSGTTSISAGLKFQPDEKYTGYLANAGDSRGILLRLRGPNTAPGSAHVSTSVNVGVVTMKAGADTDLPEKGTPVEEAGKLLEVLTIGDREFEFLASIDNKPDRKDEQKRIEDAGGNVSGDDCPRVDGNLAVSRGFADFQYKADKARPASQQKVTCVPELYEMRDMEKGDVIILCCDGIFDVLSNEELVRMVVQSLSSAPPAMDCHGVIGKTCSDVLSACMTKGSTDNMTCMIIQVGDLDYVKLGQVPAAQPNPVKRSILEQELSLPPAEKLKTQLEDDAVKKSYNVFLEMCKKDGCDLSNVDNIDMITDSNEEKKHAAAVNMGSMTQKERLQKKLEDRKKANPTPPAKNTAPPPVTPAAKVPPHQPKEDVPPNAEVKPKAKAAAQAPGTDAKAKAKTVDEDPVAGAKAKAKPASQAPPEEEDAIAAAGSEASEGKGKKKKVKKAWPDAPEPSTPVEVKLTADDEAADVGGDGAVVPEGHKKSSKSKNRKK